MAKPNEIEVYVRGQLGTHRGQGLQEKNSLGKDGMSIEGGEGNDAKTEWLCVIFEIIHLPVEEVPSPPRSPDDIKPPKKAPQGVKCPPV